MSHHNNKRKRKFQDTKITKETCFPQKLLKLASEMLNSNGVFLFFINTMTNEALKYQKATYTILVFQLTTMWLPLLTTTSRQFVLFTADCRLTGDALLFLLLSLFFFFFFLVFFFFFIIIIIIITVRMQKPAVLSTHKLTFTANYKAPSF